MKDAVMLSDSEIESLRRILRQVYISDFGSRIVDDARAILGRLSDPDLREYIALSIPIGKKPPRKSSKTRKPSRSVTRSIPIGTGPK